MVKKRYIILALGIIAILLGSLFAINVILAQTGGEYDPWMDLNDDGIIDATDLQALAFVYGTSGEPINKTELLLDLEARVTALEDKFPVTTDNIADYAVTNDKLASHAIPFSSICVTPPDADTTTSTTWGSMPGTSLIITRHRTSHLLILFSVEAMTDPPSNRIVIRALVGATTACPSTVILDPLVTGDITQLHYAAYTFNFLKTSLGAGTYSVIIQWRVVLSGGTGLARYRTLAVIALPA